MDLTSKMLRDVEFRDRLRGYDTDEVDEFLERVAVGIDELHSELAAAKSQQMAAPAPVAEPPVQRSPLEDDDSIRRTLILAQRTADLAIAEAKAEAERLLGEAQDSARRLESDAEIELSKRVARLTEEREVLERDVRAISALVDDERNRLAASLDMLQSQVSGLKVSDSFEAAANARPEPAVRIPDPAVSAPEPEAQPFLADEPATEESGDLELDLDITAITPSPAPVTGQVPTYASPSQAPSTQSDEPEVDEALWERWASSADSDKSTEDPFRFGDAEK
ncbi:MAG TPA: DivIVA domain-containing protein [Acidimicrobiales bacterium]|jgi:cell division initiation protein|nr:DivIVA domain-containing protein [Acidimicrobiales bacterium]